MEWFELLLENPQNNLSLLIILAMAFSKLLELIYRFVSGMFKTVDDENSLQSLLIGEMSARRISDDEIKREMLDHQKKHLTKIDFTTRDTNRNTYRIREDVRLIKRGFVNVVTQLKEKGIL